MNPVISRRERPLCRSVLNVISGLWTERHRGRSLQSKDIFRAGIGRLNSILTTVLQR